MFFLVGDVRSHFLPRAWADGERAVSVLPFEPGKFDLLMHPDRGSFLQFAHEIGEAMRRFQSNQQVDVIGRSADALGCAAHAVEGAAEVFVEPRAPFGGNDRFTVLRREDHMIMEAEVGGHGRLCR